MSDIKVSSKREHGRVTQIMNENFADLAKTVNKKLLNSKSSAKKLEKLSAMQIELDKLVQDREHIPVSPKLRKIFDDLEYVRDEFQDYLSSLK